MVKSDLKTPAVSVIIPCFNVAEFLPETIESVLDQTFSDFELLIYDDASTDSSLEIMRSYRARDKRIFLFSGRKNQGPAQGRNRLISEARGRYIAFFDGDDKMVPTRLEKQYRFMEENPDITILGGSLKTFGSGMRVRVRYPTSHEQIICSLIFRTALANPTIMIRTEFLRKSKIKLSLQMSISEDYDFWVKCFLYRDYPVRFANLPKVLTYYRLHEKNATKTQLKRLNEINRIIYKNILQALEIDPTEENLGDHLDFENWYYVAPGGLWRNLSRRRKWKKTLIEANDRVKLIAPEIFRNYILRKSGAHYLLKYCYIRLGINQTNLVSYLKWFYHRFLYRH